MPELSARRLSHRIHVGIQSVTAAIPRECQHARLTHVNPCSQLHNRHRRREPAGNRSPQGKGHNMPTLPFARSVLPAALLCAGLMFNPAQVVAAPESADPIRLTLHDWTGQLITTQLMAEVLKKAGYNVELVNADYLAQFAGL